MTPDELGLTEDQLWNDPATLLASRTFELAISGFEGILAGAPARIDVKARATLPVAGQHGGPTRDGFAVERKGLVVGWSLDEDRVRVARTADPVPPPETPEEEPAGGSIVTSFAFDARARLALPWQPGRHVLHVILRDRRSNALGVTLEGGDQAPLAPPAGPARIAPAPGGPERASYRSGATSLPLPDVPGIGLALEPRGDRLGPVVLRGAFKLPLLPHHRVRRWFHDVGDDDAKAVLPVALVVTGAIRGGPSVLDLAVPAFEFDGDEQHALGHFELDLAETPLLADRAPDRWTVWAFSGEAVGGPATIELTGELVIPDEPDEPGDPAPTDEPRA